MEIAHEAEQSHWRTSRIEGKAEVESNIRKLNEAAEVIHLRSYYPKEQIDRLIKGAVHLATNHELEPDFFEDPRRCMFLLAITEEWEATKDLGEKRRLLDTLSIVSAEPIPRKTLSKRVARLSGEGLERGTEFDPRVTNTYSSYWEMVLQEAEKDRDQEATAKDEARLKDWSSNSPFASIRRTLGITPETEQTTRVIRLRLTLQETFEKYGYTSMHVTTYGQEGTPPSHTLILNADADQSELEHEYAHLQGGGVGSGFGRQLDRGLNEALTEDATSSPQSYRAQRMLLTQLANDIPAFRATARRAYITGAPEDLLKMDQLIIATYGLRGRLAIARMSAEQTTHIHGRRITEYVEHPNIVLQKLR